ncbi:hypothetical protein FA13DRAFT_1792160 [Coprinellus micaceus]|uniref:Uncharacterized protein n=1 Tax=Coprinellus micaceus TaxID=71717 RepID=A0A4Y7T8X7_COPMI|nr:hypothetical protein FA13DRAFT_1792160 [Coprinellus micaceus]
MLQSFSSLPRTSASTQPPHLKSDLQRPSRVTTFRRNLSAQSRNLAMNVADGMPAKMKELLARRCLEHGTTAFTNMVLAQQLLPDSPVEEREDTFDTTEWVDYSGETLVEGDASPSTPSDKVFPLGKYPTSPDLSSASSTFALPPGSFTLPETSFALDNPSSGLDSSFTPSPFTVNYGVNTNTTYECCDPRPFDARPSAQAWDSSLAPTHNDAPQANHCFETQPNHSSVSFDLDPDLSISLAAPDDDILRGPYTGHGGDLHGYPFDLISIDDPFRDPISDAILSGLSHNPFISPGAELESYFGLRRYPEPTPYPQDRVANTDIPCARTLPTGDGEGDDSFHWDEPSMTLPGSLRQDETPYSIPDFFALR